MGWAKCSRIVISPRSARKPSRLSPTCWPGLPMTAVPTTIPSASNVSSRSVTVRVCQLPRAEYAVVDPGDDHVTDGVSDLGGYQIVAIVRRPGSRHRTGRRNRRGKKKWRRASCSSSCGPSLARRVVNAAGWHPPAAVMVEIGVSALVMKHMRHVLDQVLGRLVAAVDLVRSNPA